MWNLIAQLLCHPFIFQLLLKWGEKHPFTHLGGYMKRYWIIPDSWGLPFSVRLHHILRPDADMHLHDHPWDWRTIIVRGWYIEENVWGDKTARLAGDTAYLHHTNFHRIDYVSYGGVWTVFIMARKNSIIKQSSACQSLHCGWLLFSWVDIDITPSFNLVN